MSQWSASHDSPSAGVTQHGHGDLPCQTFVTVPTRERPVSGTYEMSTDHGQPAHGSGTVPPWLVIVTLGGAMSNGTTLRARSIVARAGLVVAAATLGLTATVSTAAAVETAPTAQETTWANVYVWIDFDNDRVFDDGEYPPGVAVTLRSTQGDTTDEATTGNTGTDGAVFPEVVHGEYLVTADVPGYDVTELRVDIDGSHGGVLRLDATWSSADTLWANVSVWVDANGNGSSDPGERPAGIVVNATNVVNNAVYKASTGNSGPGGPTGAVFASLPRGEYIVTAEVPGYDVTQKRINVGGGSEVALLRATPRSAP
jgi:hypothetical protein